MDPVNTAGKMNLMQDDADIQYSWFTKKFSALAGLDLSHYKGQQMKRRIKSYMQAKGTDGYLDFIKLLEKNPVVVIDFKNFLTINVSYFFRDADKWDELRNKYIPQLYAQKKNMSVWSAGCSIGCEPYSFSIMFDEMRPKFPLLQCQIFATDIDHAAMEQAKSGCYPQEQLKSLRPEIISKYFTMEPGKKYRVSGKILQNVKFATLNLHKDRFDGRFDIIACRNVVIYFEEKVKLELYKKFHSALHPGGVLFLGGSEIIFQSEALGFKNLSMCFYQKA